eukprot:6172296-Pleurochrysis_carterae.AAC.1
MLDVIRAAPLDAENKKSESYAELLARVEEVRAAGRDACRSDAGRSDAGGGSCGGGGDGGGGGGGGEKGARAHEAGAR